MKKIVLLGLVLGMAVPAAKAQNVKPHWVANAQLSFAPAEFSGAVGMGRQHQLGKKDRLLLGYGLRYNGYRGNGIDFITAPAALTLDDKLDTFTMASAATHAFNVYLALGYQITSKLSFMFDIDLIGATLGAERSGLFTSTDQLGFNGNYQATPTALNALLVGDNDRGTLGSNFSIHYQLKEQWGLKLGMAYLFTEYTTQQTLAFANDRFRRKSAQAMLGITYKW
ncbi:MAG: hypothetical protein Q8J69_09995 [Sphingobacteriaceae bacterium]|nr:hypothetical protein [Sphingobacteriaceae bacterium]